MPMNRRQAALTAAQHALEGSKVDITPDQLERLVDAIIASGAMATAHEQAVDQVRNPNTKLTPTQDPADNPQSGESWERTPADHAQAPPSVAEQARRDKP